MLPQLPNVWENSDYYIIWKIRIIYMNSDPFIIFTINTGVSLVMNKIFTLLVICSINVCLIIGFKYNLSTKRTQIKV